MSNDFDRDQLVSIFVAEAADDMARLWAALHPADKTYPDPQDLEDQYAVGHKLKGAALLYGFTGLGKLGEMVEIVFEEAMMIDRSKWPGAVDLVREIVASFRAQLDTINSGGTDDYQSAIEFQHRIDAYVRPSDAPVVESDASAGDSEGHDLSPEYLIPQIDAEVLSYFAPEAEEYLNTIQNLLQRLMSNSQDQELIHQLYRVSHTLKGSAYTVGFQVVGDLAHPIETCMIAVRENRALITAGWIPCLQQAVSLIRVFMRRDPAHLDQLRRDYPLVKDALGRLETGMLESDTRSFDAPSIQREPVSKITQPDVTVLRDDPLPVPTSTHHELSEAYLMPNLDPEVISYFAPEAQEYLENLEGLLLRLEKEAANPEIIHQLFRTAHTLKGSAFTVGFQSIGDLTHHIEDFMGAVREGRLHVLPGHTDLDAARFVLPCANERAVCGLYGGSETTGTDAARS